MTLKEDLAAAFADDHFSATVSEISHRVRRNRHRTVLRLAGACLAVVVAVSAGFLLRPKHSPAPVVQPTPSSSTSAGVDFDALAGRCAQTWAAAAKGRPLPPFLTRRGAAGVGVLFYADDVSAFFCSSDGTSSIANVAGDPNPHLDNGFDHMALSGASKAIFGWGPVGSQGIQAFDDKFRIEYSERFGRIFFIWDYTGEFGSQGDSKTSLSYLLYSHQPDGDIIQRVSDDEPELPDSFDRNALTQACQTAFSKLPAPGSISAAPANRFAFDKGAGKSVLFFGNQDTLISCAVSNQARNSIGITAWMRRQKVQVKPFEQLSGAGYIFGRAPEGATAGRVLLGSGKTETLLVKDGFYAASWAAKDATNVPLRVQIDTPAGPWVYENGQTTKP